MAEDVQYRFVPDLASLGTFMSLTGYRVCAVSQVMVKAEFVTGLAFALFYATLGDTMIRWAVVMAAEPCLAPPDPSWR